MSAVGAHVDQADPVGEALARAADAAQIFLGNPQSWNPPSVGYADGAAALRDAAGEAGIELWVHAPYGINVASTNNRVRIPSRKLLGQVVGLAAKIGARGVVVHGGHVSSSDDVETGYDNWRKAVEAIELPVPILIENQAGGAHAMTKELASVEALWAAVSTAAGAENVGFCLDTCHAHAAGLDLVGLTDRVRAITGRLDLVHGNDSRDAFDSGADRHTHLGAGQVDPVGLADVFATAGCSVIVETHGSVEESSADIAWVRAAQSD